MPPVSLCHVTSTFVCVCASMHVRMCQCTYEYFILWVMQWKANRAKIKRAEPCCAD